MATSLKQPPPQTSGTSIINNMQFMKLCTPQSEKCIKSFWWKHLKYSQIISEVEGLKMKTLPPNMAITASKINCLLKQGVYGLLKKYVLKEAPPPTKPMLRGTALHSLFYQTLKNYPDLTTSDKEQDIAKSIYLTLSHTSKSTLQTLQNAQIEYDLTVTDKQNNTFRGIFDLINPPQQIAYDVKSTSTTGPPHKAMKWQLTPYLVQQKIYEIVFNLKYQKPLTDFQFIMIETAYPYRTYFLRIQDSMIRLPSHAFIYEAISSYQYIAQTLLSVHKDPFQEETEMTKQEQISLIKQSKLLQNIAKTYEIEARIY